MSRSLHTALVSLLESPSLSDTELRRLIGWYALSLTDLLRRKCITVRYAEQTLFNLDVVQKLKQRRLEDCVELLDWGMQLEDWEEHTPERLPDAFAAIERLAQGLLEASPTSSSISPKSVRQQTRRQPQSGKKPVKRRSHYA
ncbi:MAG TPA: DUF3969 family protein [Methylomirabilota bacterium]|jgi:hypothetical protein|nr:DUF3969 family protein [Methylomirabilota bacterium]